MVNNNRTILQAAHGKIFIPSRHKIDIRIDMIGEEWNFF